MTTTLDRHDFDTKAVLQSVQWLASTTAAKSASTMALIDDRLVISGQCDLTPAAAADPLCGTQASASPTSFLFAIEAK